MSSEETHVYAKTGLMLRSGLSPTDAHVLIAVQPDGRLEWAYRSPNGTLTETVISAVVLDFPAALRIHVAAIYNFARRADDLADEGDDNVQTRLDALAAMGNAQKCHVQPNILPSGVNSEGCP